ncbi:MAG TPA: LacI family DNA-binding transcriptional regulator [Bryobacteraceae bacterium]|jgi:DNA-binding LacI/PurR family transcriptional regulator|nr:LacI family DNA-binding transcriptional regulator [Bryobacteraceae bacterium]
MPSIKKVAEVAGVSVGTVSHVITGSVPVSELLRNKVQAAIRQLNYHPNHVARSLKTSKTRTLGIIIPDMTISFYPQVIRGAEEAARNNDYSLIAVTSDDNADRQKDLLSLLRSQRVEGILMVVAAAPTPLNQISLIIDAGIPIVCLDRIPDRVPVDSVSVEDLEAAEMGVKHLIERGHRRIALVTGPLALKNERRRVLGYRRALESSGIGVDEKLIWSGNLRAPDVESMCREKFSNGAERPDALFCTNGPTALGVLRCFRDCHIRTPEDIGFATFDELTVPDLFTPAITTVVQPAYDIGFRAAQILLERINGTAGEGAITLRLPAHLEVRESSECRQHRPAGVTGVAEMNGLPRRY